MTGHAARWALLTAFPALLALLASGSCTVPGSPFRPGTTPPLAATPRPGGWSAALLPTAVLLEPGGTQQFTVHVQGMRGHQVQWTLSAPTAVADPGTVSPSGLYTAPARIPGGPVFVIARILQNGTQVNALAARVTVSLMGGTLLVKLTTDLPAVPGRTGATRTGLASLDRVIAIHGIQGVFPAFPFDRRGRIDRVRLDRWIFLLLDPARDALAALQAVRSDAAVEPDSVLYDRSGHAAHARQDEPREWEMRDTATRVRTEFGEFLSAADAGVRVAPAWAIATGRGVTIAIVDTGVDVNHADVAPNLWVNPGERPHAGGFTGADADGNGIEHDVHGASFSNLRLSPGKMELHFAWDLSDWFGADLWNGLNPLPPSKWGHGTCVASIAAGARNGLGRSGVAPDAKLMVVNTQAGVRPVAARRVDPGSIEPRQVASIELPATDWAKAAGIVYACSQGARVINCSWSDSHALWLLWDACAFASDNGCAIVCAVGESPSGAGGTVPRYPAAWGRRRDRFDGSSNVPGRFPAVIGGIVAVGASDERNRKAHYSDYGYADLFAPGGSGDASLDPVTGDPKILAASSFPGDDSRPQPGKDRGTKWFSGTSAATPYVSGTAALMLEVRPGLTPAQVRDILLRTAARTADGHPKLDVEAAVRKAREGP